MSTIQNNQDYITQLFALSNTQKVNNNSSTKSEKSDNVSSVGGSSSLVQVDFSQLAQKIANGEFPGGGNGQGPQLSDDQKNQLQNIFSKYKDKDLNNKDNFNSLNSELSSAGLLPEQLQSNSGSGGGNFPVQLSDDQRKKLDGIFGKYKNSNASDKNTLNSLNSDLKSAGLSPEQLFQQNKNGSQSVNSSSSIDSLLSQLLSNYQSQKS